MLVLRHYLVAEPYVIHHYELYGKSDEFEVGNG